MSRLSISSSFLVYCHLRCSLDGILLNLVKNIETCRGVPRMYTTLSLNGIKIHIETCRGVPRMYTTLSLNGIKIHTETRRGVPRMYTTLSLNGIKIHIEARRGVPRMYTTLSLKLEIPPTANFCSILFHP